MSVGSTARVCNFGSQLVKYADGLKLQELLVDLVKSGASRNTIVLLQHNHVYTIGKRGSEEDFKLDPQKLKSEGVDITVVPRGGETTYHGPGQLVAYPIMNLRSLRLGARRYVESLEDAMIRTAGAYGVSARGRLKGRTGVWVGERKIGAIGVRITHGISCHGLAFNVNTDLSRFAHIVPCGQPDKAVTSLSLEVGLGPLDLRTASSCLEGALLRSLGCTGAEHVSPGALLAELGLPVPDMDWVCTE